MNFAVLQTTLDIPPIDSLKRAFRQTTFLVPMDAFTIAKDGFGILVHRLSFENASCLQGALRSEGIETEIVAESDLVPLPQTKFTNRIDCTPAGLVIYDPIGRGFCVDWQHIMLVAAGKVIVNELKRIEKEIRQYGQIDDYGNDEPPRTEYVTKEERTEKCMLEIVIKGAVMRYCLNIDSRIPFRYLDARSSRNLTTDLSLVLQDMTRFGPHIGFNRGAFYFRENTPNALVYPSKNAFYEETAWLLWQVKKAGKLEA